MTRGLFDFGKFLGALALALMQPSAALAAPTQKARISGLSDVSFGLIVNFSVDQKNSQNICVYSQGSSGLYRVTANGSGPGGSFVLSSGNDSMPYEVQWSDVPGQATGTSLAPGIPLTGLSSDAGNQNCQSGPPATASLITILRGSDVSVARAGSYSGTITLLLAPE